MVENVNNIVSPVGRIVQGSPCVGNDKDISGRPKVDKNGNPVTQYFIKLAIEKTNPDFAGIWQEILNAAKSAFPSYAQVIDGLVANNATPDVILAQLGQNITLRVQDGDSTLPDKNGKIWRDKPGFAGHWVLHFGTGFAPQLVMQDPRQIVTDQQYSCFNRGNYARVVTNINHDNNNGCNLYLNMMIVQFMGYGEPISAGPDAGAILGGNNPAGYVPAGMSTVPVAGAAAPAAPAAQPGQIPAPAAAQPGQIPAPAAPAAQPGQIPAPAAPAAQPGQIPAPAAQPGQIPAPAAPAAPAAQPGQIQPNPAFLNAPDNPTA